jgi:hypothetical protein
LLIPVTPATMPNPQSPLCVMLNDSQNLPWVLQWAWPPIRVVEAEGVLSSTIEPCSSERLPLEATFAHALPGLWSGSVRQRITGTETEVGHLMSFIAIEAPSGFPIPAVSMMGNQTTNSTFFEFSDSWMNSLSRSEGCSVVGYFRYLQLVDESSEEGTSHALPRNAFRPHTQVVGVMDHYVYKSFRSEARALMLLQSVSFYMHQLGLVLANKASFSDSNPPQRPWRVVMRCKSQHLPQLRLMQKLYRMAFLHGCCPPLGSGVKATPLILSNSARRRDLNAVRVQYKGNGELLHVYFSVDLVQVLLSQLAGGIRCAPPHSYATIGYDTTQLQPLETPFESLIAHTREKWRLDNEPFHAKDRPNPRLDRSHQDHGATPCSGAPTPNINSAPLFPILRPPTPCGFSSAGEGSLTSLSERSSQTRRAERIDGRGNETTTSMTSTPPSFSSEGASFCSRLDMERSDGVPASYTRRPGSVALLVDTPIQFNCGDGEWHCGFWVEPLEGVYLHWFDPSTDQTALLEHWGPINVRNMAGEYELITPTHRGKVYLAVAPHVEVLGYSFPWLQFLRATGTDALSVGCRLV